MFFSSTPVRCTFFAMYVDDILVIKSDVVGIAHVKAYLNHNQTNHDLGTLSWFLLES